MKQIRLVWRSNVAHLRDAVPFSDAWIGDSEESRVTMAIVLDAALEIYGPDTHWVEQRDTLAAQ